MLRIIVEYQDCTHSITTIFYGFSLRNYGLTAPCKCVIIRKDRITIQNGIERSAADLKFNYELGKIYDTIFFGCLHFHKEVIFDRVREALDESRYASEAIEELYREVNEHLPPLPAILSPFFFPPEHRPCALTQFFDEQIDFSQDTIDCFLQKITENSGLLYSHLANTLLSGASPSATDEYVRALTEASYPQELKLQLSLLFGNYPYAVSLLTEHLQKIYRQIVLLHEKYKQKVLETAEQVQGSYLSGEFDQYLQRRYSKPISKVEIANGSITVLHMVLRMHQIDLAEDGDPKRSVVMVGTQYAEAMRIDAGIDPQNIFYALGNKTRFAILKAFAEQGEMTAAGIARALQLPASTAIAQVELLYEKGLLLFVRKKGLQLFYKLNYSVLRNTFRLMNEYLDEWEQK